MNLYNTVSEILGKEVSTDEAKEFAVGQFGALSAYLKEQARKELTIESAKQFLKDNGYFVDNLWTVHDVKDKYECTEEQAQKVLYNALTNETTMEQIHFSIDEFAGLENLPKIGSKYFSVSGFWKDDKVKFSNYIVKEFDDVDEDDDTEIFYYGLSASDIEELIIEKWNSEHEFVITSYEETTLN